MSTSDTSIIDEKKGTISSIANNFNVGNFLKDLLKRFIYMLIYIFISAFVLYGTKIYGPYVIKDNSTYNYSNNYGGTKGGNHGKEPFGKNELIYKPPTEKIYSANLNFVKKQVHDTYIYTMYMLIYFFNILYSFNNDTLVALFGPILLAVMIIYLTIFGIIFFIYHYILNLLVNFVGNDDIVGILLCMFFIALFYLLALMIPIIQIFMVLYCLVRILGYPSITRLPNGTTKSNFSGFLHVFFSYFYTLIFIYSCYIMITSSFNILGQQYGMICAFIVFLIFTGIIDVGFYTKKQ
jgi:hypothetical protein